MPGYNVTTNEPTLQMPLHGLARLHRQHLHHMREAIVEQALVDLAFEFLTNNKMESFEFSGEHIKGHGQLRGWRATGAATDLLWGVGFKHKNTTGFQRVDNATM